MQPFLVLYSHFSSQLALRQFKSEVNADNRLSLHTSGPEVKGQLVNVSAGPWPWPLQLTLLQLGMLIRFTLHCLRCFKGSIIGKLYGGHRLLGEHTQTHWKGKRWMHSERVERKTPKRVCVNRGVIVIWPWRAGKWICVFLGALLPTLVMDRCYHGNLFLWSELYVRVLVCAHFKHLKKNN